VLIGAVMIILNFLGEGWGLIVPYGLFILGFTLLFKGRAQQSIIKDFSKKVTDSGILDNDI
jgi:hypothetical protein